MADFGAVSANSPTAGGLFYWKLMNEPINLRGPLSEWITYNLGAISYDKWKLFLDELKEINHRDFIIAICLIGLYKVRISEILNIKLDEVEISRDYFVFKFQNKTLCFKLPMEYAYELLLYIQDMKEDFLDINKNNFLFCTRNGKVVTRSRINYSFGIVRKKTGIHVTPESLRS